MSSAKRKFPVILGFAVLLSLALAVGCHGFFVNPTLTSITVTPATPTLTVDTSLQMTATGTYDDGSIKTLTGNVTWNSSSPDVVTVTSGGLINGVATGTSTLSASSGIATGSTTVTVSPANLSSISITPQSTSVVNGNAITYTATGNIAGGGTVDVSQSASWTSNASSGTITFSPNTGGVGEIATTSNFTTSQTVTITASVITNTGTVTGTATLTVNVQ